SKTALSHLSNLRGFVKAEEGSRGGWWLPLWNQDVDDLEGSLGSPFNSNNGDGEGGHDNHENSRDSDRVVGEGGENTSKSTPQNARSASPEISTPVFVVPSSNESSRPNSPQQSATTPLTNNQNSEEPLKTTVSNNNIDPLLHQDTFKDVNLVND
ncbi:6419_t:CDS:2, partial [Funneliformis caledonium]